MGGPRAVHPRDKYDYSRVEYVNKTTKVVIICPIHGEFEQIPVNHAFHGHGCFRCASTRNGRTRRMSTETWIEQARAVHGLRYDYTKVQYVTAFDKVTIVCPEHGEFLQTPVSHVRVVGAVQHALIGR
ncbi:hypothetical protein SAZ11_08775 [Streptomyces sp. FXJ1.4098]|nr:hypothetical protein [Streptomyces sp. FXJ1.4098]